MCQPNMTNTLWSRAFNSFWLRAYGGLYGASKQTPNENESLKNQNSKQDTGIPDEYMKM